MRRSLLGGAVVALAWSAAGACSVQEYGSGGGTDGLAACETFEQDVDSCPESPGPFRCPSETVAKCLLATHITPCRIEFHFEELSQSDMDAVNACVGPTCLGDDGAAPTCTSECEGTTNCGILQDLRAGVAADVATCLNSLDAQSCTKANDAYAKCVLVSLSKACDEGTSGPVCTDLASDCQGTNDASWQSGCVDRFAGLTNDSVTTVKACMADACAAGAPAGTDALLAQLDSCVTDLFDK